MVPTQITSPRVGRLWTYVVITRVAVFLASPAFPRENSGGRQTMVRYLWVLVHLFKCTYICVATCAEGRGCKYSFVSRYGIKCSQMYTNESIYVCVLFYSGKP